MLRIFISIFITLHGLVHLWYFTLSQRLIKFQPEMGWTGESWLFKNMMSESTVRFIASILFIITSVLFIISGVGYLLNTKWWQLIIIISSLLSSLILLLFWDGNLSQIVEKGIIGLLINIGILIIVLIIKP